MSLGILEEVGRLLGNVLTSLIHVFNPKILLLNGGVSGQGQCLLDLVEKTVRAQIMVSFQVPVRLGALGPDANLLGAAVLIRDHLNRLDLNGGKLA